MKSLTTHQYQENEAYREVKLNIEKLLNPTSLVFSGEEKWREINIHSGKIKR